MTMSIRNKSRSGAAKLLIPVGDTVSKQLITQALHTLSVFRDPTIVLFHVVEVPSRTASLETEQYRSEIVEANTRLADLARWLIDQGFHVKKKVAVARNTVDGILQEIENENYNVVILLKRRKKKGLRHLLERSVSELVIRSARCFVMTALLEQ
jgi:nucleotide-binding universal stress UspA family protein